MFPRPFAAVSFSLTTALALACGACGASRPAAGSPSTPPPTEPIELPRTAARTAEPARDAPPSPSEASRSKLGAGAPFYGAYEVRRIVKTGGEVVSSAGLEGCRDISDCVLRRRSYSFEGRTLRLRYILVAVTDKTGDESLTTICDAQAQVDVQWEGDVMVLATTVVAKANSDIERRKQRQTKPGAYKVDWSSDHLGCSVTLQAGRYRVKELPREMRGNRPARIVLETPEETHELEAVDENVDVKRAINAFFGQT